MSTNSSPRQLLSHLSTLFETVTIKQAPWSPRVGMGLVSQQFYNSTAGENVTGSHERLVLVGGYGGEDVGDTNYDGIHCRSDVWESHDGRNWTMLTQDAGFGERAWFSMVVSHAADNRYDITDTAKSLSPRMWMFGGGNIGTYTHTNARKYKMEGYYDTWTSRDGIVWTQVNYQEGGGTSFLPQYTSQEWGKTTVDSNVLYLGLWGTTAVVFNATSKNSVSDVLKQ
jgi:hypothetical protein